ncbi:MAG: M23 family metallopeptidase [Microbacteriaceae bacterium]
MHRATIGLLALLVIGVCPGATGATGATGTAAASIGTDNDTDTAGGALWQWPVDVAHVIVRPYIAPATPYGSGHRGLDLAAGERLLAPADGVVSYAGVVVDRGVLSIDHGGEIISSYEPVTTPLKTGDVVHAGDVIATIDTGHCSIPCVHLGVRLDGDYVSPLLYLGGVPRAVLLPTRSLD